MKVHVCKRIGMQFYAEPMFYRVPNLPHFEKAPQRGELYVICHDGSIQSVWNPERRIGWFLMESSDPNSSYYYCFDGEAKPCMVSYHATSENPPKGYGVKFEDHPQNAEILEQPDDGVEVTSDCPGAPRKAPKVSEAINLEKITKNLGADFAFAAEL